MRCTPLQRCALISGNRCIYLFLVAIFSRHPPTMKLASNVVAISIILMLECCKSTALLFSFTGNYQEFTVPVGITEMNVTLVGASGGVSSTTKGGRGARITSIVPVLPGEVYRIYCGGIGGKGSLIAPGYNGGGPGKGTFPLTTAGGGGTDLRAFPYSINDRIMVAGGGGGASGNCGTVGGDAGWPNGLIAPACSYYVRGGGGTQTKGGDGGSGDSLAVLTIANSGSFFYGGEALSSTPFGNSYGGGGGGGYYGGGGSYGVGGGGGSSYTKYSILEATNGVWTGDGYAEVTFLGGDPTMQPSANPSTIPSTAPSMTPSEAPSLNPTINPSAAPSATPTFFPSAIPSVAPSLVPTTNPSVSPSMNPTNAPTTSPTQAPTVAPTTVPTVRPTLQTVQPYEVVLGIEQDVYFINKDDYDSQKVQCNLTIQYTVAVALEGVIPERVTDIAVEEEEEERRGNMRALVTTVAPPVSLKYTVTVFDPVLSAEVLTEQLITKVKSGDMDHAFRAFAVMFNATRLENCTFAEPRVTVLNEAYNGDPANSGEIAGFVLGGFLFVMLLTGGVWLLVRYLKKNEESNKGQVVQEKSVSTV